MHRLLQRLLVVEDDVAVARALCRTLTRAGFTVVSARSCSDARSLEQVFDATILDLDLPDGNGVDLARALMAEARAPNILFFTSCTDPTLLARARCLGSVVMKSLGTGPILSWLETTAREGTDIPQSGTAPSARARDQRASSSPQRRSRTR